MLFRRRIKSRWPERVHEFFWPRKGLTRPARYLAKRILRLSASPHAVAAGVAVGTFSAFTPLLGFHALLALALAYLVAGNLLAAALATTIANPLTIPVIAAATFRLGEAVLGMKSGDTATAGDLFHSLEHLELAQLWQPVLKPMLVGGGIFGLAAGAVAYGGTRFAVRTFKARRHQRLLARAGLAPGAPSPVLMPGDPNP